MLKRVELYMVPDDPGCNEVLDFLEQQDLRLMIRDLTSRPLQADEISRLFRHFDMRHFLNSSSKVYSRRKLDKDLPNRKEIIELMAGDNELIRKPIIVAGRLMVVGPNRHKIMEMLQIKPNGSDPSEEKEKSSAKSRRETK